MELQIPESLFESLQIIIKYQNTLLLKEISKEKGWKLSELKKEFLKEEDIQNLLKKYSKKKNKVKKKVSPKKIVEETEDTNEVDTNEVGTNEVDTNEVASNETATNEVDTNEVDTNEVEKSESKKKEENIQFEIEPIKNKKKKLKKIVKEKEIKCHKYTFDGAVFYVNIENENAYDKNMEFVGRKLGNGINFDADELEN